MNDRNFRTKVAGLLGPRKVAYHGRKLHRDSGLTVPALSKRVEAFIIHLARAEKRKPQVDLLTTQLPMPVHVLDAVDGSALEARQIEAVYRRELHRPHYPFALRTAEIGCFLSHRKAWKAIVDRGLDAGLIVEDDVELDADRFGQVLAAALKAVQPTDFIRFPYRRYTDRGLRTAIGDGGALVEPSFVGLGMQMQLVGRQAAIEFLKSTEVFDRPVDTMIQMRWLTQARILAAKPVCIRHIHERLGGTVTQNKAKPLREILSREIRRAFYRLSQRAAALGKR